MTAPGRVARGRPARAPGDSPTDPAGGNGASPVAGTPFAAKAPAAARAPAAGKAPAAAKPALPGNLRSR